MNIHAREYMAETQLTTKRALNDAIAAYGCDSDYSRDLATDAIASGRAAFWTRNSRHNACATILLNNLNRGMSFEDALADAYRPHKRDRIEGGLDTLIPL